MAFEEMQRITDACPGYCRNTTACRVLLMAPVQLYSSNCNQPG